MIETHSGNGGIVMVPIEADHRCYLLLSVTFTLNGQTRTPLQTILVVDQVRATCVITTLSPGQFAFHSAMVIVQRTTIARTAIVNCKAEGEMLLMRQNGLLARQYQSPLLRPGPLLPGLHLDKALI